MKMTKKHLANGCGLPMAPANETIRDFAIATLLDAIQAGNENEVQRLTVKLGGKLHQPEFQLCIHEWKVATARQDLPYAKAIKVYLSKIEPKSVIVKRDDVEANEPNAKTAPLEPGKANPKGEVMNKKTTVAAVEPQRKVTKPSIAKKTGPAVPTPEVKEGTGRFTLFDQPVTAVLRALGKAGCTFERVRKVLNKKHIACADATIKIQLTAGAKGLRGEPAKLSKAQIAEFKS